MTCRIKFIDSVRFMTSSLSSILDDLAEELYNIKFKDCKSCFEYIKFKDKLIILKRLKCDKNQLSKKIFKHI